MCHNFLNTFIVIQNLQLLSIDIDRAAILAKMLHWKWQYCCIKPLIKPIFLCLQLVCWLIAVSCQVLTLGAGIEHFFCTSLVPRRLLRNGWRGLLLCGTGEDQAYWLIALRAARVWQQIQQEKHSGIVHNQPD